MDPDPPAIVLALVLALIAANAFFVAAEFSLLAVRRARLEQKARMGDHLTSKVPELSLAAQLGSTATTLALGFIIGHTAIESLGAVGGLPAQLVEPLRIPAVIVAVVLACALHVLLGEQVPKLVGMQKAEWFLTRIALRPLRVFAVIVLPLTWILAAALRRVAKLFNLPLSGVSPLASTPDEIRMLVSHGHEHGVVEEDEREMIDGVFQFSDTVAREVMTPRPDMVAVPEDVTLDELIDLVTMEGHSRVPVYEGSIDTIVGILLAKDLLPILKSSTAGPFSARAVMREPYFVPDTKPVDDILAEFRQQSVHLAIVLDEFGGTYGLLTMEDLLEEIVGEINDEYDVAEQEFSATPEGDVLIDGGASISEVNERFGLGISESNFDTIGGFVFGALGRVPVPGETVAVPGTEEDYNLVVEELDERRITRIRLIRAEIVPPATPPAAS
ncbi:MAG TPA: hemolysin family protein [Longimicrobiaceae bacterium]|nr:hemolysin family protein [Longimicrobiaceae bacterium]